MKHSSTCVFSRARRTLRTSRIVLCATTMLVTACAAHEPIDLEETDPAINPAITKLIDDGTQEPRDEGNRMKFPDFNYIVEQLAFPGAEGHGRQASGARSVAGRELYRVTNLNASGPGSFADAVSKPGRFIIFGVAGVINLNKSTLVLKSNQTILFQTAPGDGVTLYNGRVSSSGASNLIVRFMRVRTGRQMNGSDNADAGGLANGELQIYDHCSFTWWIGTCRQCIDQLDCSGLLL